MLVRDCECLRCGHLWTQAIELNAVTPNISGEATIYCPRCGSRGTSAEPARDGQPVYRMVRVSYVERGHNEGRCQACSNHGEERGTRPPVYVIELEGRNITTMIRLCETCRVELVAQLRDVGAAQKAEC